MSSTVPQVIRTILNARGRSRDRLLPILMDIQRHFNYLPADALDVLSRDSEITAAQIEEVVQFYAWFRLRPVGRHSIKVCDGTACHVKGAPQVYNALRSALTIEGAEDTDPDGEFTVQKVFCLGCCTLAPAVQIDTITYGHLTPDKVERMLDDFRRLSTGTAPRSSVGRGRRQGEVRICLDSCCRARGSGKAHQALTEAIARTGVPVDVKQVSCVVMCERAPLLEIATNTGQQASYSGLPPADIERALLRHFQPPGWWQRLCNHLRQGMDLMANPDAADVPLERYVSGVHDPPVAAFFGPQQHIATEGFGQLEPLDIGGYRRSGGLEALQICQYQSSPEEILAQLKASNLRGRGGAGFPTARKWESVRQSNLADKRIIVNADEGDPGAFMDRMLLESFPLRVLEGMAIAALTVGARRATIYVRAEYPFAVERLRQAIGLLKEEAIWPKALQIEVFEGAGAFVCGEETALLASLAGRRGMASLRPPYPAEQGILINNVETLAVIPWILRHGGEAFASIGSAASSGSKVFALAGKIRHGGLIEVPMGVTLRQIVDEIGGGMPPGSELKAVMIGGPSGGCLPASLLDTPVDYDSLQEAGAIMGSGGLIVLDQHDCMVAVARYFMQFCQAESCGRCAPCRDGTGKLLDLLDKLCQGHGKAADLDLLEELAGHVESGSLCGLGRTAPGPLRTALRYFRAEFEAHLRGTCPAGVCPALIHYRITDRCVGCTLCAQRCPVAAIPMAPYRRHEVLDDVCTRCGICQEVCPENAVEVI